MVENGEDATVLALNELLKEADGIPVSMEEQKLLTVGLKARQWKIKVSEVLSAGGTKLATLKKLSSEAADLKHKFPASAQGSK